MEEIIIDQEVTPRQQHIAELHRLLDIWEDNPDFPMPYNFGRASWDEVYLMPKNPVQAAEMVRALGVGGWRKNDPNTSEHDAANLIMTKVLDRECHVKIIVSREGVCEKKVVGTETKKVTKVVQERVTEEVYEEVDVVTFECKSLLSLADQKVMGELEALA